MDCFGNITNDKQYKIILVEYIKESIFERND